MMDSYFWRMSPLKRLIFLKRFAGQGGGGGSTITTVTDTLLHILDALAKPAKEFVVNIEPNQSGSGDPSPENIRPITGWTGCNVYQSGADTSNPTTIHYTFPDDAGTVYGGTLTINEDGSGVLVRKFTRVKISSLTLGIVNGVFRASSNYTGGNTGWCEVYKKTSSSPANAPDKSIRFASQAWDTNNRIFIKDSSFTTVADLKAAVGDYYIVYMLRSPVTYNLTAEQIQLLLGENNIWTDVNGTLTLTYYASK